MAVKTFNLPDPGEGLVEAEIIEWRVAPGDTVKVNDMVLEVETSKSLVELPIPWAGTVKELLVEVGQTVDVGTPIITIDDGSAEPEAEESSGGAILVGYGAKESSSSRRARRGAGSAAPAAAPSQPTPMPPTAAELPTATPAVAEPTTATPRSAEPEPLANPAVAEQVSASDTGRPRCKPPVRKLAKDLGVDLSQVVGTGDDGIITRADVQAFAAGGKPEPSASSPAAQASSAASADRPAASAPFGAGEREVRTPVKGVRKVTAQAMVGSAFTAPHVTEWITLDATATVELVERLKRDKEFRDVKVTPLLVLAKAICVAIRRNPGMNAVWDEANQEIVQKNYVNLGIAAATPRGLLVPNIKDAHAMSMLELAAAVGELTETARQGRTQPADMAGGTITITNVGVFGVDAGTPIINPGESAIVCFGAIRKQPWVVTNAAGEDELAIRHVTTLAVSFDHRLIDGELGSRFLADVARILEEPSRGFVWG